MSFPPRRSPEVQRDAAVLIAGGGESACSCGPGRWRGRRGGWRPWSVRCWPRSRDGGRTCPPSNLVVAAAAIAGAALAGTTWRALAPPAATLAPWEAVLLGLLAGLAASLALAAAGLERVVARPMVGALAQARTDAHGEERALAERAAAAHDGIAGDLGGTRATTATGSGGWPRT